MNKSKIQNTLNQKTINLQSHLNWKINYLKKAMNMAMVIGYVFRKEKNKTWISITF